MSNRLGQLNMPHALTAHAGQSHLHTAAVTDHPTVLNALVFSARAFPVFNRAKNAFTEQASFFRLKSAIIYRFRVLYFPLGPGPDGIRRRHGNGDVIHLVHLPHAQQFLGCLFLNCICSRHYLFSCYPVQLFFIVCEQRGQYIFPRTFFFFSLAKAWTFLKRGLKSGVVLKLLSTG